MWRALGGGLAVLAGILICSCNSQPKEGNGTTMVSTAQASGSEAGATHIRLWDGDAPGAVGNAPFDIPTLTPFLVEKQKASGAAFIVCPGGGYQHLAPHEGAPVAQWLNTLGIQSFVLKYRLGPTYRNPIEMGDVQRAIRLIRANAAQWGIDPKRIGILGFSAGGHLASTAATHFDDGNVQVTDPVDRVSCRPDLTILIYPVISMSNVYVHSGSRTMLLGDHPDPELEKLMSSDLQVTPKTPPCFLVHGADDRTVPVENSLLFAMACHKNKVPFELHIFQHGPHGFGLGGTDRELKTWPGMAANWLEKNNFVKK
jgi:acetyl esterase/lipase